MEVHVLLLVVASAAVHVTWNVMARLARGSARFAWLANLAGAAVLFALLALATCAVPAWRAARVDLMRALRSE